MAVSRFEIVEGAPLEVQPCSLLSCATPLAFSPGMNLASGIEQDEHMFSVVAISSALMCICAFMGVFSLFYRQGILVS